MEEELEYIPNLVENENEEIVFEKVKKEPIDTTGTIIEEDKSKKVPVTILTGYLGSGNLPFLNR